MDCFLTQYRDTVFVFQLLWITNPGAASAGALLAPPRPEEGLRFECFGKTNPWFSKTFRTQANSCFQDQHNLSCQMTTFKHGRKIPRISSLRKRNSHLYKLHTRVQPMISEAPNHSHVMLNIALDQFRFGGVDWSIPSGFRLLRWTDWLITAGFVKFVLGGCGVCGWGNPMCMYFPFLQVLAESWRWGAKSVLHGSRRSGKACNLVHPWKHPQIYSSEGY